MAGTIMMKASVTFVCSLLLFVIPVMGQDKTRLIGTSGTDLVLSVIDQIRQSGIFPPDSNFFLFLGRASYLASMDGGNPDTYRPGFGGGIWQITEAQFQATQNTAAFPGLVDKISRIQEEFGINWLSLTWNDLRTPFHSGLAESLFFCTIPEVIPQSVAEQARVWSQFVANGRPAQTYMDIVNSLPDLTPDPNCPGNQRGISPNLQEYGRLSWTPPPNIRAAGSSFGGASDVQIAPGVSYLFTNEYTDTNNNVKTCVFTGSTSAGTAPPMAYCPSNLMMFVPEDASSMTISWSPPRANIPMIRKNRNPDETSIFTVGYHLVEYIFEQRDTNNNVIDLPVCAFVVSVVRGGPVMPPAGPVEGDLIGDGICGTRPAVGLQPRIVSGNPAPAGSVPWIGSLQDDFGNHLCGATLIRARWAITAAHCIVDPGVTIPTKIVFGDISLSTTSANRQESTFTQFFNYPFYDSNDDIAEFDLTLLYLANEIQVTDFVRPMCLATNANEGNTYRNCQSAGWGSLTENGQYPDDLQVVGLPLIPTATCRAPPFNKNPTSNIICAGGENRNLAGDTCQGDSGGPLICQSNGDNAFHLVGVVSVGDGCGRPQSPGFYTRITSFIGWIRGTIQGAEGVMLP
ncbi:uncharacterized protein [Amphiura filiformis]|uniref:uncharacterized protein n=1 Tax=Amphiura filiformis TaxID=82378 RepID=UPI003B21DAC0